MFLKLFFVFGTIQVALANHLLIYQKDNSVIATKPVKTALPQEHKFIPTNLSHYNIVTNQLDTPPALQKADDEILPEDILEIAKTKLGIKNLDEIPNISELGKLLGTSSREETIETIRQIISTDSGIDLIKAFIESSDYTDIGESREDILTEAEDSRPSLSTSILSETVQKDIDIARKILTTPKPELGFIQRAKSYLNFFDLFPANKEIPISPVNEEIRQLKPKTQENHHASHNQRNYKLQPVLVASHLPHSFPVLILPIGLYPSTPFSVQQSPSMRGNLQYPNHNNQKRILGEIYGN